VASSAVVNASPLIFMANGQCFDLLRIAANTIVMPAAVANEIQRRGPEDLTFRAVRRATWLVAVDDPPVPSLIQSWDLGPGESAVLAWAHANPGTEAIVDDLAARRCAATLGIPVRGTLGLVLLAKRRGIIAQARPVLEKMVHSGMYLSDRLLKEVLAIVGE